MCIAIPLGNKKETNESALWHAIRTEPLYLLSLGGVLQILSALIFLLSIKTGLINASSVSLDVDLIIAYTLLFGVGGFAYFALSMHYCPIKMHTGNIEYLYYGGLFYLASYNMLIFYLANFFSYALVVGSVIVHLLLMLFAFKPIWHAYFWTDKKNKKFGQFINILFFILLSSQLIVFWLIL